MEKSRKKIVYKIQPECLKNLLNWQIDSIYKIPHYIASYIVLSSIHKSLKIDQGFGLKGQESNGQKLLAACLCELYSTRVVVN